MEKDIFTLVDELVLNTLFKEFYKEIKEASRIVYYNGNRLGFNDNIYTSDDLLHDFYFSIKKYAIKGNFYIKNKDHFLAISYLRMKNVYMKYLVKKWNRAKTEYGYFSDVGYTYRPEEIMAKIFDTDKEGFLKEGVLEKDILDLIDDFDNDEQKRILTLKTKHVTNEKLAKYLGLSKNELRSKVYYSRKKMFKKMSESNLLNDEVKYEDIVGRERENVLMYEHLDNKDNYYNDYPFDASYKEKILFILSKNNNKINVEKLRLILKINEGKSLKQDSRNSVNKSINKNIEEKKCFIMEGTLYLNLKQ